ncbi:MAG: hypothetical protein A2283_18465 [Lentisphaerae bacterium RIFOXYA12_FULL_48_11]|nr:MAG: hypothetical protein A2283_18465 [Lentisphaerae bacterium RIFOXYA12_FULL_48_11]
MNDSDTRKRLTDDPRVPLAAERTLLAWIRTGLALMGFGFVVARFGLFLQEMAGIEKHIPQTHGFSVKLGVVLILLGVIVNLASAWKYRNYLKRLKNGEIPIPEPLLGISLAFLLGIIGIAATVYLLFL